MKIYQLSRTHDTSFGFFGASDVCAMLVKKSNPSFYLFQMLKINQLLLASLPKTRI